MTAPRKIDAAILEHGDPTPLQRKVIEAVIRLGSLSAASAEMDMDLANVSRAVRVVEAKAARNGYAPGNWESPVAPGYLMGKVTVHRTASGEVIQTWERQSPEHEAQVAAIKAAVESFIEGVGPLPAAPAPSKRQGDIIPWINIGDGHLGMLAHEMQTGEKFDLSIGQRELCAAAAILIDELPPSERIVINDLGDMTHFENEKGVTEASGHQLDCAAPLSTVIRVYSRVMRFIVEKALEKAAVVDVMINPGNHSRKNDWWMAELLRVAYGHTGRVNVLDNDGAFIVYRMGKTLVLCHHSDKCKPDKLIDVLATDYAQDWGETEYRYIDVGHVHHKKTSSEEAGARWESFNNLAPMDKFAHDYGWRSKASITCVLRSRTYGEVGRRVLPIREVRDRIVEALKGAGGPGAIYRPRERRAFSV